MDIKVNFEQYAKNVLKNLEKDLKKAKKNNDLTLVEMLTKDIKRHKENNAEYLK